MRDWEIVEAATAQPKLLGRVGTESDMTEPLDCADIRGDVQNAVRLQVRMPIGFSTNLSPTGDVAWQCYKSHYLLQ